jgi:DNA-binding Lrp family transcriptional regulator
MNDADVVRALQDGLPLVPRPYRAVAESLRVAPDELMARLREMLADGRVRRVGAVPNHYALGYVANGMSVWDVDDAAIGELGPRVGALEFVSHCYRRPRRPPAWRYNLFAMVHGRARNEVEAKVGEIAALLGAACRAHDVLYSVRILKKTGLRFGI